MYTALTETELTETELTDIKSLTHRLDTALDSTVGIPNCVIEELDADFITVFDRLRHVDPNELTDSQVGWIANLTIAYFTFKVEFSQSVFWACTCVALFWVALLGRIPQRQRSSPILMKPYTLWRRRLYILSLISF